VFGHFGSHIDVMSARGVVPLTHSVATLVNSLQNRVKVAYHSVRNIERKHWENSSCDAMHSDRMAVL